MSGDWVYDSGEPAKLTKGRLAMLLFLDDDSKVGPIPLDEYTLVKNWFEKFIMNVNGDYRQYRLGRFTINWAKQEGFWYGDGDIKINHVHQLQHLLRLAGVEKEIEL
jgi:hypothetical protein